MDAEKVIKRGRNARQLLSDSTLTDAFEDIKSDILSKFQTSNEGDSAKREQLYFQLKAVELLQIKLSAYDSNGTFEQLKLDKIKP